MLLAGAPQGRIGGLLSLTKRMGDDLNIDALVCTSRFKTSGTYGYQPVIVPPFVRQLFSQFVATIRPGILKQLPIKNQQRLNKPSAPLWINLHGNVINGAQFISSFFRKRADLNICPNKIRCLLSTGTLFALLL